MFSHINREIVYPLYFAVNKDRRLHILKDIEKNQWLSKDEILGRQFESFINLLNYAYENVPYYKAKYDDLQISVKDIKTFDDVKLLPILTKKDLQENLEKLVSSVCPISQRYTESSGGSTGHPTILYSDRKAIPFKSAAALMTNKWTGWKIGEKVACLWGADRDLNPINNLKTYIVEKFVLRNVTLNAFDITEKKIESFVKMIIREKPSLIVAYTNMAFLLAEHVRKNGIADITPPKGIVCSAETLTEEKRKVIEDSFRCKVLNRYGSRETGLIASECDRQEGLHINSNDIFLELEPIEADSGNANLSEIIVTELNSRVMPLIRYNMGDLATPMEKSCSCGRGFPLIAKVLGRTSDFIIHPDGRLIHGEFFSHAFYKMPGIRQFQIVQNNKNLIEINVVPSGSYTSDDKTAILNSLRIVLGNEINIELFEVEQISTPISGKFRFAICNLGKNAPDSHE